MVDIKRNTKISDLKARVQSECEQVPFSQITANVRGKRSQKKSGHYRSSSLSDLRNIKGDLQANGDVVIFNPHDIARVYTSGCYGKGTLSRGVPYECLDGSEQLVLLAVEACYLVQQGCLQLHQGNMLTLDDAWDVWVKCDTEFREKYAVYKYFRDKGYVVRSAVKYGGDFLLYTGDPNSCHAGYVTKVVTKPLQWTAVNALRRVSESVAKETVLCYVSNSENSNSPDATVTTVLLKRWIPERERELTDEKIESTDK